MRILVTGATGFIGSHFANVASAAGHDVIALRRLGSTPRVPVSERVSWLEKSMAAVSAEDCRGMEAVVHFAAAGVSPPKANWSECFGTNVMDSLTFWNAALAGGVRRLVVCGSCFEYGASGNRYQAIPPSAPLEPIGPYHASKAASMATLALTHRRRHDNEPDAFRWRLSGPDARDARIYRRSD